MEHQGVRGGWLEGREMGERVILGKLWTMKVALASFQSIGAKNISLSKILIKSLPKICNTLVKVLQEWNTSIFLLFSFSNRKESLFFSFFKRKYVYEMVGYSSLYGKEKKKNIKNTLGTTKILLLLLILKKKKRVYMYLGNLINIKNFQRYFLIC